MTDLSQTLKISVVTSDADENLSPVTDATVVLVTSASVTEKWPYSGQASTHTFETSTNGYTQFTGAAGGEPAAGEWLLIVSKPGMSPVTQHLTLAEFTWKEARIQHTALRAAPGWASKKEAGDGARAVTVEITNAGKGVPKVGIPAITEIKVLLLPRTEFVGFACHNHHDKTDYHQFTEGRRAILYVRGTNKQRATYQGAKLNKGSLVTIFHADKRIKRVQVKAAKKSPMSWITVYEEEKAPLAADAGKLRPYDTTANELGTLEFFAHLDSIGRDHPGTCVESGIFGHGWANGPILWGTNDDSDSTVDRDPNDLDGRQKDWLRDGETATTVTGTVTVGPTQRAYPNLAKAFMKTSDFSGRFRAWGCAHMRRTISEMSVAWTRFALLDAHKTNRSERFFIPLRDLKVDQGFGQLQGWEFATLDQVKANVFSYAASRRFARIEEDGDARRSVNYLGAAAQFLNDAGIVVFGAPPGMGSLYKKTDTGVNGESVMTFFIQLSGGENGSAHRYLKREFGSFYDQDEDGLGYLNYTKLLETPAATFTDPGWDTGRAMAFFDSDRGAAVLRLPSGTEVHKRIAINPSIPEYLDHPELDAGVSPGRAFRQPKAHTPDGHLYVLPKTIPDEVHLRGPLRVLVLRRDAIHDTALHVRTDGRTLILWRSQPKAPFEPYRDTIAVITMVYSNGGKWNPPLSPSGLSITDGVLESEAPRYYW